MQYSKEQLILKYESAKSNHTKWLQLYYQAFRYVVPQRDSLNQILNYVDQGINNTQQIYSNVAPVSAIFRANKLTRMLMPSDQKWGSLKYNGSDGLTSEDIAQAEKKLYTEINESNLAQQIQDAFVDECVSAGALWVESPTSEKPLTFQSVPGFAVMPEFYTGNEIRDVWYPFSASAQFILNNYPDLDSSFKGVLLAKPNETYWVIRGALYDPLENEPSKKWRIVDLLDCNNIGQATGYSVIFDENYGYQKLFYFRDRVRPGEVNGRGPGIEYLPTIERLNVLERLSIEAAELRAFPPTEIDNAKINTLQISNFAGSTVPIDTFGRSLELPPSPDVEAKIEKLEMAVRKGFSVEPLGNLEQPVRTASEINERMEEAKVNTTIDVSRLLQESSKPIFESCFAILLEMDLVPNNAKFKKEILDNPKSIVFSYENPLGDVESNNNMLALTQTMQFSQQFLGPTAWTAQFDIAKLADFIRDNSRVEADLFKDGDALRQNISNAIKQAQQGPVGPQNPLPNATTAPASPDPLTPQGVAL